MHAGCHTGQVQKAKPSSPTDPKLLIHLLGTLPTFIPIILTFATFVVAWKCRRPGGVSLCGRPPGLSGWACGQRIFHEKGPRASGVAK
jgi:hypothetical protein